MRVVVGLGSNLGDRAAHLRASAKAIERMAPVAGRSHIYESAPVGPPQPHYLNAAVRVDWERSAHEMLDGLLVIERRLGRVRPDPVRWGPRIIDLDILWIEGLAVHDERLVVPHPRLRERTFALVPLLEVAPDAVDPETGRPFVVATRKPGELVLTNLTWRASS